MELKGSVCCNVQLNTLRTTVLENVCLTVQAIRIILLTGNQEHV